MQIEITAETGTAMERLSTLGTEIPRALTRALNRTLSEANTAAARALAEDTGLSQSRVKQNLIATKATFDTLAATLTLSGRRIPLLDFGARQTNKGVSYRIGAKGRGTVLHAFLATMASGHEGVFARRPWAVSRRMGPGVYHGLPIVELHGPSLTHVAQKPEIQEAVVGRIVEAFPKNLEHEVDYITGGGTPTGGTD